MGSQVLKLLLTTRNFWLLSPSSSSELLLPSLAMAMVDTGMVDTAEDTVAMVATEDTTTARGLLMLSLRLRLVLSPPPPPSPDMDTTAMDMDTTLTDTAMLLLTPTDIITTARGPLMLSPDMATTAVDTEDTMEVMVIMVMVMVTATDTTVEKFQKFMLIQSD